MKYSEFEKVESLWLEFLKRVTCLTDKLNVDQVLSLNKYGFMFMESGMIMNEFLDRLETVIKAEVQGRKN